MANYRFDDNGNEIMPETKTVSWVNAYIKQLLEEEMLLQDIYISGEISNFKHHTTGHMYFSLKDEKSEIRAVMFKKENNKIIFKPENGMKVIVHGRISAWGGNYQFYADFMQPDGIGSLYLAYEQLKNRLYDEGLFNEEHKKQLPEFPERIGIITSDTGAAVRDIIHVATRRYPCARIILYPSLVQGAEAVPELIRGVEYFNITESADVIIIGRGGGSIEDLWAFNDEMLARAIYNSHIPIISAVGHEINFTICDYVADVRAATPSSAAEMATPDINEIKNQLNVFVRRTYKSFSSTVSIYKASLESISKSRAFKHPEMLFDAFKMRLLTNAENLDSVMKVKLVMFRTALASVGERMSALNPMAVLSRGYGAIFGENEKIIKSALSVKSGETINVKLHDGCISASVFKIERSDEVND